MTSNGPKKIGKYDVEKIIGRGGMGVVYKAIDAALGRPVAIKMMTASYAEDADLLKRFYREAQFTGNLHHPNIVTVYDLGDLEGNPYFVMEFLEGESLDSIIGSRREVSLLQKLSYITQVCSGLEYAHRQRVVHRDIKPANVMVMKDGAVKIVDFGIARLGNDRLTRPQQVMGSYHYMSPEQINDKEVDARTDIFSTGVVLYQLLTGRLPFDASDVVSTLMKVINTPAPPLSEFVSGYPQELDEIVNKALQKNKEDRYQSAEEFSFDVLQVSEKLTQEEIGGILQHAEGLCEEGDLTAAREEALQALRLDRQSTRANEMLRRIQQLALKRQHVESARVLVAQAEESLANRDFGHAFESLEEAKALDTSDVFLGKAVEVVRILKERSDKLRNAIREAASARAAGRLEAAQKAINEALEIEPEDPQVVELVQAISRDLNEQKLRKELESLLEQARTQIANDRFSDALNVLTKARSLGMESHTVTELIERANNGLEQERRRRERDRLISSIEGALSRKEFKSACDVADEALHQFPADARLLELKQSAEEQRADDERRRCIQDQIDAAQRLVEQGRTSDAQEVLKAALERYPAQSMLQSAISSVEHRIALEVAEHRKSEYIRNAKDSIRRKAYEDAIQSLMRAKSEYPGNDFDDLLQFAHEQQNKDELELKIEAITKEARGHLDADEHEQAIEIVESALREMPVESLKILAAEARRRLVEFQRGVQDAISNSQRLLDLERADQAVGMLQSQPRSYSRVPEFVSALENARRMQAKLQTIDAAKQQIWELLADGNLDGASTLLEQCCSDFGARGDLDQLRHEIESERARLRVRAFETEIVEAEMLARMGSHEAAIRTLDSVSESVASVPPQLKSRYDSVRQHSIAELERLKVEAEKRERERIRAESQERERKERERRQAEEYARKESEAKAKQEAEGKAKREAEVRKQERQAKERQEAEKRAREEAEIRQRRKLEEQLQAQKQADKDDKDKDTDAGPDLTLPYGPMGPIRPTAPPVRGGDQRTFVPQNKKSEPNVAELTPPQGLAIHGPTSSWRVEDTRISAGPPSAASNEAPPAELGESSLKTAPPLSHETAVPLPQTEPSGGVPAKLIAGAVAVALVLGAGWFLLRPHPATSTVAVEFATSPPGIQLRVKDQGCVSPCRMSLPDGNYVVNAQLDGYKSAEIPFSVNKSEGSKTVNVSLQQMSNTSTASASVSENAAGAAAAAAKTGTLIVHANVNDAKVFIDDKESGTTSDGTFQIPLVPKRHRIRVEKDGFEKSRPQWATIRAGAESQATFKLKPAPSASSTASADNKTTQSAATSNNQAKPAQTEDTTKLAAQSQTPQQPASQPPQVVAPKPQPPADDGSQLWASIGNSTRREDFENFRNHFPNSPHADQAAKKIEQIDWEDARAKKDESSIQAFLTKYPNGPFSDIARKELQKLQAQKLQAADRQAIVSVLKTFEGAYNTRNADELASIWPGLPKQELKKIRDSFKQANAVNMRLQYSDPTINGDRASVNCKRSVQFTFKEGARPEVTDHVTIQLHKTDGAWRVDSVR